MTTDTPQQKRVLRTSKAAKRTREQFPEGTRVRGRVGGQLGTVERHVPGANSQGGYLLVRWDVNDHVGRVGPITVERVVTAEEFQETADDLGISVVELEAGLL